MQRGQRETDELFGIDWNSNLATLYFDEGLQKFVQHYDKCLNSDDH